MFVTEYIRTFGLDKLVEQFAIKVNDYENYVALNYNQIDSPRFIPVVEECRGLILDKHTWEPLCRSFNRFYNYGEDQNASKFPIEKAICGTKLDGSLINIWFDPYASCWRIATRGMAHAEGFCRQGIKTFAQLVEQVIGTDINTFMGDAENGFTYICELTTPENRIVTPYEDYKLWLLSVRELKSGLELEVATEHYASVLGLDRPQEFRFGSWDEVIEAARNLPTLDEGYVLRVVLEDGRVWRIKCKNPSYLAVAHLRENGVIGLRRIASLVMMGETEEYLSYFPEDECSFTPLAEAKERMMQEIHSLWEANKDLESQKDFALAVKDSAVASILFSMRKGKSMEDCLKEIEGDKAERFLGRYRVSQEAPEKSMATE